MTVGCSMSARPAEKWPQTATLSARRSGREAIGARSGRSGTENGRDVNLPKALIRPLE